MAYSKDSKSAAVRAHLDHPVIDGDGHWLEPMPIFLDYLRDVGGPVRGRALREEGRPSAVVRVEPRGAPGAPAHRPTWWGEPANTLDRATAMVPAPLLRAARRLRHRLLPCSTPRSASSTSSQSRRGAAPGWPARREPDERGDVRALSRTASTPAAVVPVHTPEEAIEEATYAVRELGMKVLMIANHVRRPVPARRGRCRRRHATRGCTSTPSAYDSALRLRPVLGERCARAQGGRHRALRQHGLARARVRQQLHLQPHRPLRQRQPRLRQGPHPRRRHQALPQPPLRLPGGRRGLGVQPRHRPGRPLGASATARPWSSTDRPTQPRPRRAQRPLRAVRRPVYEDKLDEILAASASAEPFKTAEELTEREYKEQLRRLRGGAGSTRSTTLKRTSPSTSTSAARPTTP